MTLRVTFDTNVLDLACRPERFPKDARQPRLARVHQALQDGEILGFYPVTMLTIEGIENADRAAVFRSTTSTVEEGPPTITRAADVPSAVQAKIGDRDIEAVSMTIRTSQPARKALHPEVVNRMVAAKALGVRVLKAPPRIDAFRIDDPTGEYYLANGEDEAALETWLNTIQAAAHAIEQRGLGYAQVRSLGQTLAARSPAELWFRALEHAEDIHEKRAVQRAFSEWADGDALASHIAYGLDVFCSADVGNSNARDSVLDPINRAWLTATYGIQFMTFDDLLANLP